MGRRRADPTVYADETEYTDGDEYEDDDRSSYISERYPPTPRHPQYAPSAPPPPTGFRPMGPGPPPSAMRGPPSTAWRPPPAFGGPGSALPPPPPSAVAPRANPISATERAWRHSAQLRWLAAGAAAVGGGLLVTALIVNNLATVAVKPPVVIMLRQAGSGAYRIFTEPPERPSRSDGDCARLNGLRARDQCRRQARRPDPLRARCGAAARRD